MVDLWLLRTNRDGGRVRSTLLGEGSVDDSFFDRQILIPQQFDLDDNLCDRHCKTLSNALREPSGAILGRF